MELVIGNYKGVVDGDERIGVFCVVVGIICILFCEVGLNVNNFVYEFFDDWVCDFF